MSTCETRPQVQNDRSQHTLENECFREFPKNDADQGIPYAKLYAEDAFPESVAGFTFMLKS